MVLIARHDARAVLNRAPRAVEVYRRVRVGGVHVRSAKAVLGPDENHARSRMLQFPFHLSHVARAAAKSNGAVYMTVGHGSGIRTYRTPVCHAGTVWLCCTRVQLKNKSGVHDGRA